MAARHRRVVSDATISTVRRDVNAAQFQMGSRRFGYVVPCRHTFFRVDAHAQLTAVLPRSLCTGVVRFGAMP